MEQGIDQRSASSGEVFLSVAVSQLTLVCCGTRCPGTTRFQDGTLQGHSPRGVGPQDHWSWGPLRLVWESPGPQGWGDFLTGDLKLITRGSTGEKGD